jgi:hypothetical protein
MVNHEHQPERGGVVPEVIDIRATGGDRHDGDVEADEPTSGRRVVAVAVATVLVAFAVAYLVLGRDGRGQSTPREAAPKDIKAQVVGVASGALQAWGRFAVSGRLEELTPFFDSDGPQFAQFRREAAELAAHPPGPPEYRFAMSGATAERKGDDWIVRGPVVVSRAGEADQRFSWELVVRQRSGGWAVWTVRESGGGPASTVGGKP